MDYKIGDKIRIKKRGCFHKDFDKALNDLNPKRIVTIKRILGGDYWVEEIIWRIERLQIEGIVLKSIENRWEILDIRRDE